jgi:hypothetical protein
VLVEFLRRAKVPLNKIGAVLQVDKLEPKHIVSLWLEMKSRKANRPGAYMAKCLIEDGIGCSPAITIEAIAEAIDAGIVQQIWDGANWLHVAGQKLGRNSHGLHINDALVLPTARLDQVAFA